MNEYEQILKSIRKKRFSDMEPWEKFLMNQERTERRKRKKQYENEYPVDPNVFEYKWGR
jgi:hypothetical protein